MKKKATDTTKDNQVIPRNQSSPMAEVSSVLDRVSTLFDAFSHEEFGTKKDFFWNEYLQDMFHKNPMDSFVTGDQEVEEVIELEKKSRKEGKTVSFLKLLGSAFIACAYSVDAMKAEKAEQMTLAWELAASARYWQGVMEGYAGATPEIDEAKSLFARKGAAVRHSENHQLRQEVIDWYKDNQHKFKSKSKAAGAAYAAKLVPAEHRTIYDWIRAYKEDSHPARKP